MPFIRGLGGRGCGLNLMSKLPWASLNAQGSRDHERSGGVQAVDRPESGHAAQLPSGRVFSFVRWVSLKRKQKKQFSTSPLIQLQLAADKDVCACVCVCVGKLSSQFTGVTVIEPGSSPCRCSPTELWRPLPSTFP